MKLTYVFLLMLLMIWKTAHSQHLESMTQINYGDLPEQVQLALNREITKMDLSSIRFNFYGIDNTDNYAIEFLMSGLDLEALAGLEMILFANDGVILEKRYKYYLEDILLYVPLEYIMQIQDKVDASNLDYIRKFAPKDKEPDYRVLADDSVYIFDSNMKYIQAIERKKNQAH